jgi:hypothetical protein
MGVATARSQGRYSARSTRLSSFPASVRGSSSHLPTAGPLDVKVRLDRVQLGKHGVAVTDVARVGQPRRHSGRVLEPAGPGSGRELAADEAVFCEPSSVTAFLTEEHIVIDNPA